MEKAQVSPSVTVSHDLWNKRLQINVSLPDVDQKNISLDLKDDGFCITAPRNATVYSGCFLLDHEVETDRAEAIYEEGVFRIVAPFKGSAAWDRLREGFMGRPVVKG